MIAVLLSHPLQKHHEEGHEDYLQSFALTGFQLREHSIHEEEVVDMPNVVKNGMMMEATQVTEMEVNGEGALVFGLPI